MSPLALVAEDPEGGFVVCDTRDGLDLAWRNALPDAAAVASMLNGRYPAGIPAPAHDSLVHEIVMDRIGDGPEMALGMLPDFELAQMIPDAIDGPLDPGLWRPNYEEEDR